MPQDLPTGTAVIDLGALLKHITRAHDPNVPGFAAGQRVRGYPLWPFHRYGPLLSRRLWLRALSVADRLDPRKKGIVAEDVALGFAGHAMQLLGAGPVITKWELSQADRRPILAQMLRDAGVAPREATRAAQYALRGLAGADLVGYSSRREAWIVCESKGTLGDAPDPAVIRTFLPDPWIPPNGRRGRPGTTLSQPHRAMRQKRQTAGAVQALGIGKVESYAVLTSVGTETNQNPTVVDFIDPEAPRDIATVLSRNTTVVRELVAQAHFAWISDLFHLDLPLWGADADTLLRYDEAQRLQADVVVPVDDGALAFRLAFDAAIYPALASRSVALLDEYSSRQPQHPDGLSVSLIDGPEALADEADQVTLDEAYREQ